MLHRLCLLLCCMAITTGLYAQSITLQHNLPMNGGLVDCSTLVGQQTFQISYTATAPPTSWYGLLSNIFSSCDHDGATFVVRLENMATGNTFTHSFGGDPNNPIHGNQFSGVFNVPISPDNNAYRLSTFSNGSTSTGAYCDIAEENLFIFWTIGTKKCNLNPIKGGLLLFFVLAFRFSSSHNF